jgi:hypothetical protein
MIHLMDQYKEEMEKIALAIQSVQMAKSLLVECEGIGQDLPATLMCWHDHKISAMVQAGPDVANQTPARKLSDLSTIALIAKTGWRASAMTLVVEGYCKMTDDSTETRPLDEAFVDNPSVSECLTFIHVENEDPLIVVSPYSVGLGRVTSFHPPKLSYREPFARHFEPLMAALQHEVDGDRVDPDRRDASARKLIDSLGWVVLDVDA